MRLTTLGQMIKGDQAGMATVAALDRIKWLPWRGNVRDAIDDIESLADEATVDLEENPNSRPLGMFAAALAEFATYIAHNDGHMVAQGERVRAGERISTGFVEPAINQIVDERFDKRQSVRWAPRGANLLLRTRIPVLNGDLE